ncbi:DUF6074 family protein [Pseudaminobacter soli (ex Li et al. 2025)]|uniref:Uncharacterized protein n=1 Tax=Pseudaminobacter soli (ex Li et al. 2025) TaxID=1295366 RepID=A0A2P7S4J3_9HYPH|nr:DUF6074 family protein [Mesorhizobium soli]PSJ57387.1 hypothetical protein C7I85_22650 [Mesorhizobium soli]
MKPDDLPLFAWRPSVGEVVTFPLARQGKKVSETARKLLEKTTERHADYYRGQVTDALVKRLHRLGIADHVIDEQVGAFWTAVEWEMARLTYRGQRPGGGAA